MKTGYYFVFISILLLCDVSVHAETVKRVRNESTVHCRASNVMGSGNLSAFTGMSSSITRIALQANPFIGARIGIAEIMQIQGQASLLDFNRLGPALVHLQLTTPKNDRLRFFGLAISADLHLSTSQDTFSVNTESSKPEYSPFLTGSLLSDIDWVALWSHVPLKTYLNVGLVNDPQALHQYQQLQILKGFEWKMLEHSLFLEAGGAFYKEKPSRTNATGDQSFEQWHTWIQPGARYRLHKKISVVCGLGVTLAAKTHEGKNITPSILNFSFRVEAPIAFKETDTEAIRTLVFMEQKKNGSKYSSANHLNDSVITQYDEVVRGLDLQQESFDYNTENQELRKKREQIQQKMEEIEQMLKETEHE